MWFNFGRKTESKKVESESLEEKLAKLQHQMALVKLENSKLKDVIKVFQENELSAEAVIDFSVTSVFSLERVYLPDSSSYITDVCVLENNEFTTFHLTSSIGNHYRLIEAWTAFKNSKIELATTVTEHVLETTAVENKVVDYTNNIVFTTPVYNISCEQKFLPAIKHLEKVTVTPVVEIEPTPVVEIEPTPVVEIEPTLRSKKVSLLKKDTFPENLECYFDFNKIEAFSVERGKIGNEDASIIGFLLNGTVKEWSLQCSIDSHLSLLRDFRDSLLK